MKAERRLKPDVGFVEFASCDGCLRTIVDSGATLLAVMEEVEVKQFRLAMQLPIELRGKYPGHFHVLFVEGLIETEEEAEELRDYRSRSTYLVALGACAHTGGMPGVKDEKQVQDQIDGKWGKLTQKQGPHLPRRISDVVKVDAVIPGCPIDLGHFVTALKVLLEGGIPRDSGHSLCKSCVLNGNECLLDKGQICLGPITNEGCNATCIANNYGCFGCRGLVKNPEVEWLFRILEKKGFEAKDIRRKMTLYNNLQLKEIENEEK